MQEEIEKSIDEINLILKEIKKSGVKEHNLIEAKTKLKKLGEAKEEKSDNTSDHIISIGDKVTISNSGISGIVIEINKSAVKDTSSTYDASKNNSSSFSSIKISNASSGVSIF